MLNQFFRFVILSAFFAAIGTNTATTQADSTHLKFDFGTGKAAPGYAQVLPTTIYSKELGYGFEHGATITSFDHGKDALRGDGVSSDKPFYFSVALPEGNYRVTVTFGDLESETSTTVKAELRRLMLEQVQTAKGKFETRGFIVNVRTPQFPGGQVRLKDREKTTEWWAWDEKLTLEFNGSRPTINAIEIAKVDLPTVYLLGDSTVADQPREPYNSWGQMLTRFFQPNIAIANHAESGESLKSSLGARRLDKVLSLIKPGDYLFLQFGHNDMKEKGEGIGAFTSYKNDLKKFVAEASKRGATPIVVTPMHRRTFDAAGKITNSLNDYPEAVRQVANEEHVALIDLNAMSKRLYEALGPEKSGALFKEGDATHHSNYGSYELAKCIIVGIKAAKLTIAKLLVKDTPPFDPNKPDSITSFKIPASPLETQTKPLGQ